MEKLTATMNGKRIPVTVVKNETGEPFIDLKEQLDILGELLHDLRNLDPSIEGMPGWKRAVESGALDGWA